MVSEVLSAASILAMFIKSRTMDTYVYSNMKIFFLWQMKMLFYILHNMLYFFYINTNNVFKKLINVYSKIKCFFCDKMVVGRFLLKMAGCWRWLSNLIWQQVGWFMQRAVDAPLAAFIEIWLLILRLNITLFSSYNDISTNNLANYSIVWPLARE